MPDPFPAFRKGGNHALPLASSGTRTARPIAVRVQGPAVGIFGGRASSKRPILSQLWNRVGIQNTTLLGPFNRHIGEAVAQTHALVLALRHTRQLHFQLVTLAVQNFWLES